LNHRDRNLIYARLFVWSFPDGAKALELFLLIAYVKGEPTSSAVVCPGIALSRSISPGDPDNIHATVLPPDQASLHKTSSFLSCLFPSSLLVVLPWFGR
jgi:hypothetical protein